MSKAIGIVLWVGIIFATGLKTKYPEIGGVIENALNGVIGAGATGLLFTKAVQSK